MATQKVGIEFVGTINTQSMKTAAAEMNRVISKSGASKETIKASEKELKSVIEAANQIDRILSKPKISQTDLSRLKDLTDAIGKSNISLEKTMNSFGPGITTAMAEISNKIAEIEKATKQSAQGIKAGFREVTGTSYDRSAEIAKAKKAEMKVTERALEEARILELTKAEQIVNAKEAAKAQEVADAKAEQDKLLKDYNKKYGTDLKNYQEYLNTKTTLNKKSMAPEQISDFSILGTGMQRQETIIKAQRNKPLGQTKITQEISKLVEKNTKAEADAYANATKSYREYDSARRSSAAQLGNLNKVSGENIQKLKEEYSILEKDSLNKHTQERRTLIDVLFRGSQAQKEATAALDKNQQAMIKASVKSQAFGKIADDLGGRIGRLTSTYFIWMKAIQEFNKAKSIVSGLDAEITQIGIVTKQTGDELWNTFGTFNKLAQELSTTTKQYLEGAKIFYQQGLNTAEVMSMVEATTKAAVLAGVDFASASETLTAAIKAYNMEATQAMAVTDKFSAVGAASAADFRELSIAMEKVASQAYASGMSFDSLLGILAKGIETTREAPEAIGTGLKSIIARFQEMKENPMASLEDGIDANRVEKALRSVGVALRDANGEFRNMDDVFADLGATWPSLTRNQKAYIATMAAGSRQQSRFLAIMNNYDRTLQLVRTSTNSAGEANAQYAIYEDSVEAAQQRLNNTMEKFYTQILTSDILKGIYDGLNIVMQIVSDLNPGFLALATTVGIVTTKLSSFLAIAKIEAGMDLLQVVNKGKVVQAYSEWILKLIMGTKYVSAMDLAQKRNTLSVAEATLANIAKTDSEALATAQEAVNTAQTDLNTAAKLRNASSTKALTLATVGWIAVAAIAIVGIIALVKYLEKQRNAVHELAAETRKQADEVKQSYQNLDSQIQRYEELSKIVSKTKEEQAEYNDIIKQIADNSPNLIEGIDSEGNYILKRNEYLKEEIKLRQEAARAAEIQAYQAKLASMKSAQWNATLEKGAAGPKTVEISSQIQKQINTLAKEVKWYDNNKPGKANDSFKMQMEAAVMLNYDKGALLAIQKRYTLEVKKQWGESDDAFDERKRRLQSQYNSLYTSIINLQEVRLAETKKVVADGLYQIGQQEIDALKFSGEKISNEYQDITAGFSFDVTTIAQNLTTAQMGITEEEAAKMSGADKIMKYSEHIQQTWMAEAEQMRKLPGFDKALSDLMKKQELGLSATEWKKELDAFQLKFGNMNTAAGREMMSSFRNTIFDEEQFNKTLGEFREFITDSSIRIDFNMLFKSMSTKLTTAIIDAVNGIDTEAAKDQYLTAITKVFSNSDFKKSFEDSLKNVDITDPGALAELQKNLEEQFRLSNYAPELAAKFAQETMQTYLSSADSFINRIMTLNDELDKIVEKGSKPLSFAEGLKAIEEYGAESVQMVGDQFIIKQDYILRKKWDLEKKQLSGINAILDGINKEIEDYQKTGIDANDSIIVGLKQQKQTYEDIKIELEKVTEIEKERAASALEQQQYSIFKATTDKLKDYGDILKQAQDGMTQLDLAILGNEYPEFVDVVNGKFVLLKDSIYAAADAEMAAAKQAYENTIKENDALIEKIELMDKIALDELIIQIRTEQRSSAQIKTSIEEAKGNLKLAESKLQDAEATKEQTSNLIENIKTRIVSLKLAEDELRKSGDSVAGSTSIFSSFINQEMEYVNSFNNANKTIDEQKIKIKELNDEIQQYSKDLTVSRLAETLKAMGYDLQNIQRADILAALEKMGMKASDAANALNKMDPKKLMDELANGSKNAADATDKLNDSLEKNYNLIEKINDLENDLSNIESRIDLNSTGAKQDIQLLKEKASKINGLIDLQKRLLKARKEDLRQMQDENQVRYASWVQIVGENAVILDQIALSKALMSGSINQEFYDGLKQYVEGYNDLSDSIKESESALVDLEKQQEEMYDSIIQQVIDTRQKLYDAILEADQTELEAAQEKYDKLTEMENDYLNAVKKAIDEERKARENASKVEDLARKQRKLAVLQKDTSGLYAAEAQKLAQEILKDQQALRDEAVDEQLSALEEQTRIQQEQRDIQIQLLEEQIKFREDTGFYWDRVDDAIQNGPEDMTRLLTSTRDYHKSDPIEQSRQLKEIQNSVEYLNRLYNDGKTLTKDDDVISAIEAAVDKIIKQQAAQGDTNLGESPSTSTSSKTTIPTGTITPTTPTTTKNIDLELKKLQITMNKIAGIGNGMPEDGIKGSLTYSGMQRLVSQMKSYVQRLPDSIAVPYSIKLDKVLQNRTIDDTFIKIFKMIYGDTPFLPLPPSGTKFEKGGLVDFTGPAWVDGTKDKPEAFLNAKQTEMFNDLKYLLMKNNTGDIISGARGLSNSVSIGDIVINLQNRTNADAKEIAQQVKNEIIGTYSNKMSISVKGTR